MEKYYVELGKMLRALRKEHGYLQETIAEVMGVGRATYGDFELAKIRPQITDLLRLAEIYHVPPEVFLHPKDYQSVKEIRSLTRKDAEKK